MSLFGPPDVKKIEAKRDVKGLIKALRYEQDAKVRRDAARALGRIGDARAVEPLINALKDGVVDVREAAAQALDALKWKPDKGEAGIAYWIQKGKNDKDRTTRQSAINALGQIGEPAVRPLIAELESGSWTRSSNAAAALGLIGDPRAVEPLIATLAVHGKSNSVVHNAAVEALGQIGDARAVEPLIAALRDETSKVHETVIKALGKIGAPAVDPLIAVLKDGSPIVRAAAAKGLGQTGDPRAVEPLNAALSDNDWYPRQKAAEALDLLGWKPDLDKTGARYWIVKGNYKECVAIGAEAMDLLIAELEDGNASESAVEALESLGWHPDRHAAGATYWIVKGEANRCVEIGAPAVKPLIAARNSRERTARKAAANALVDLYQSGKLDDENKQLILAKRSTITQPYNEHYSQHSDQQTCFEHTDEWEQRHADSGIGVDFPL